MLGGGRCFHPKLELLPKGFKVNTAVRQCAFSKKSELSIKIPPRVERGPTDILKALSLTVKDDETSVHYKYPDDPFFCPFSNLFKRRLALSMESGRKSARWIFQNNPKFFNAKIAEPLIQAYLQKPVYDEKSEVTEKILIKVIGDRNVRDAMSLYDICQKKGIEISKDTKQLLLELVCFYNCEERPDEEELGIRWFDSPRNTIDFCGQWKNNGFAEKLFQSFGTECPLAVSTIIQGYLKYNETKKALELFNPVRNSMNLSIGVYNGFLSQVVNIMEGYLNRWNYVQELLNEMAEKNMKPNLETLNAVMKTFYQMPTWRERSNAVFKVMGEFSKLGVEPSLGTYFYLINIIYSSKNFGSKDETLFIQILHHLFGKKLELRHRSDTIFFSSVMYIATSILMKPQLTHLIHDLLLKDDNIKFLCSNTDEAFYFKNYLTFLFELEPIEFAMEIYKKIVPSKYSPEIKVFVCILSMIEETKAFNFLPKIYEDVIKLRVSKRPMILEGFLRMSPHFSENKEGEALNILYEIAMTAYDLLEDEEEKSKIFYKEQLRDSVISNMLITFVKKDDETKARDIFASFGDLADLNPLAVWEFCKYCMSKQNLSLILECLKYAEKKRYLEASKMAAEALPHLSELVESDLKWVTELANRQL